MELERYTYAERPEFAELLESEEDDAFPEFLLHDHIWNRSWPHVIGEFADYQFALYDSEGKELLGGGNAVPFRWDGTLEDLPNGTHDLLLRSIDEHSKQIAPNTIAGIQAIATSKGRGRGLGEEFVNAGRWRAERFGFEYWLAPLRLLLKDRYPLTPLEEYVEWEREDGSAFDPWLRVWLRAGAEILKVSNAALVIEGTVEEWEEWTALELPASGEYVIPGGQVPLTVDRARGTARYSESHLWTQMPIDR